MAEETAAPVTVLCGDARTLLGVRPESVALVVTSPPYPMIPQWDVLFERLGGRDFETMHRILDRAWEACGRVLVRGGILAIVVGDALRRVDGSFQLWPNHARILVGASALGYQPLPYILWKKPTNKPNAFLGSGFLPPNAYVTLDCEFILLLRKGRLREFPARSSAREASAYRRGERDHWFSQVWEDIRGAPQGRTGIRSGAFPSEIPRRLIRMFSVVGDVILDPFAGTGTTLWVAHELGRRAIGVELDPVSVRRLREKARGLASEPPRKPRPGQAERPAPGEPRGV